VNLLVEGRPGGKPLSLYLENAGSAQMLARLSARWLARFHSTPLTGVPDWDAEGNLDRLAGEAGALAEHRPELEERIAILAARLAGGLRCMDLDEPVPTHGAFRPENVHVGRGRVSVGDFGGVAMGHPARDLAQFIAASLAASYSLHRAFLPVDTWNCAFIQEYVALEGPGCLPPLPLLIARELLAHLRLSLAREGTVPAESADAFLGECTRWLNAGNVTR
jgi:aminoglycoside phosphotransferase (APT) family kinase protein